MAKSRVLVVGGTGYIGKRLVKASLAAGHRTYVLRRPEIGLDMDKMQILLEFKKQGAELVEASFSDHRSLVEAVNKVEVVISAMSGVHFRTHNLLMQLKLVGAIKQAGNIKLGWDTPLNLVEMAVRKAIEDANIPHTYVVANFFAGYFVGNLSQMGTLLPPLTKVLIYGNGNVKAVFMDEYDVATYAVKSIDDPRTLHIRPPENILSQLELVAKWEKLTGNPLEKTTISNEDFLALMKGANFAEQVGIGHFYHIFYEGCLTNFDIGEDGEEASGLYPEVHYKRMEEYLKLYL